MSMHFSQCVVFLCFAFAVHLGNVEEMLTIFHLFIYFMGGRGASLFIIAKTPKQHVDTSRKMVPTAPFNKQARIPILNEYKYIMHCQELFHLFSRSGGLFVVWKSL